MIRRLCGLIFVCMGVTPLAQAMEDRADVEPNAPVSASQPIAYKLTLSQYRQTQDASSNDINLRGNRDNDAFWLGHYMQGTDFQQTRAGYEHQSRWGRWRSVAGLQIASQGFVGGSWTWLYEPAELGPSWLLGWGRTNTQPYVNLNFDPNDSTLWGLGWRTETSAWTLYQVKDDKLQTSQTVTHLVWRWSRADAPSLAMDLFTREGRADKFSPLVSGTGLSLGLEQGAYFVRVVWDPRVNFTESDMLRIAAGRRF